LETKRKHERVKDTAIVLKEEIIELEYVPEDESGKWQNKKKGTGYFTKDMLSRRVNPILCVFAQ
jgi:hypothetical protein